MKRMNIEQTKVINGGGSKHYHWFCNLYNYRSKRYNSFDEAQRGADNHIANYPKHLYNTYVIECSGNCGE